MVKMRHLPVSIEFICHSFLSVSSRDSSAEFWALADNFINTIPTHTRLRGLKLAKAGQRVDCKQICRPKWERRRTGYVLGDN